ncbi:MAG TPA: hypothetical protein VFR70_01625 [Flavobacterium sp.]|nr:hypothetical protein [Flavobacterium sp.]
MNNNRKELSAIELIGRGYLLVNIPIAAIILAVWYCLTTYLEINGRMSAIIGVAAGWIYWELTIKKWVRWALDNNAEPERLLKIGQLSLLLWSRATIDKVLDEKK